MPSLSERLKDLSEAYGWASDKAILEEAAAVRAAVEAFQAAEQALKVAQMAVIERLGDERNAELRLAQREYAATLARLVQA